MELTRSTRRRSGTSLSPKWMKLPGPSWFGAGATPARRPGTGQTRTAQSIAWSSWFEGQAIRICDTGNPDLEDHGGKIVYIHDALEGLIGTNAEFYRAMIPPDCEIPPLWAQQTQSASDNREGGIAAILQGTIPLVCAACRTTTRDLFSGVIQNYAGNPTNHTYREILCRNCKQDEVDAREREQQALSDKLKDKCKDCGITFCLEEISKTQRGKAVGKRSCTECASKRNPKRRLSAPTPGSSTTTQQQDATPTLYPTPLQTGEPAHHEDQGRHREVDRKGPHPKCDAAEEINAPEAAWSRFVDTFFQREIEGHRIMRSNIDTPRGRRIRREILLSESDFCTTPRGSIPWGILVDEILGREVIAHWNQWSDLKQLPSAEARIQKLESMDEEFSQARITHDSDPHAPSGWAIPWLRMVRTFLIREINAQRILRSNLGRHSRSMGLQILRSMYPVRREEERSTDGGKGLDSSPQETTPAGDQLSPFAVMILAKSPGLRKYEIGPVIGKGQATHIRWQAAFDAPDWLGETLAPGQRLKIGYPREKTPTPGTDHREGTADDIMNGRWTTSARCHTCGQTTRQTRCDGKGLLQCRGCGQREGVAAEKPVRHMPSASRTEWRDQGYPSTNPEKATIDRHIATILPGGLETPFPQGLPAGVRERSKARIVRYVQMSAQDGTNLQFPDGLLLADPSQLHPVVGADSGAGPERSPEEVIHGSPLPGQPAAKVRPRGKSGLCKIPRQDGQICGRRPSRPIPCRHCQRKMGGGCCAVNHIPGAPDGICYRCHSQLQGQAAGHPARNSPPPRPQMTGRMPHWTEIVNRLAVRPCQTADTDEGDSDDADWLRSVLGRPHDQEADRDTASVNASISCAICGNGPNRWADHRIAGKTCSTCASDRGLGPFSPSHQAQPDPRQSQGRATRSAAGIPWTTCQGLLTSPAAQEVGREIGGK